MFPANTVDWNDTEVDYPQNWTIAQLFEAQATLRPEEIAIIFGDQRLSYRELNAHANQLARHLQSCGVGTETLVGVAIERSPEMMIALLAILKAGGAYVPLDPSYPSLRIALMIEDSGTPVILTTGRTQHRLPTTAARVIAIDRERDAIARHSADPLPSSNAASNLAYVIYTSGSTGKPKGVMIEQRNVVNFFEGMDRAIGPEPGVWLAVTSISFDISVLELFWTLTRGFTVVIHGDEGPQTIPSEIAQHQVTHLQCTPSLARMLSLDSRSLSELGKLRKLFLGGEALPSSLVGQLRHVFHGEMYNMYGPTETTIWSTTYRIREDLKNIPIGRPIANTQVYVLDSNYKPVPQGKVGDLYIGGAGVVRGYWKRQELTAERFLADPFRMGNRIYRTGDIARFLPDGNLEFLGRADFQIKLRGFRIELAEIEILLEQQPGVQQAVMMVREDKSGDTRLVAYIVRRSDQAVTASSLLAVIEAKLPEYMVPSSFVFLEKLPLTANGKIDRNALPAPSMQNQTSERTDENPRNEIERLISQVWKEALGVDHVGLRDNFFDMGAHSLMVAEVHAQLQQLLGREISLVDLFEFPTVSALARHLGGEQEKRPASNRAQRRLAARQAKTTV